MAQGYKQNREWSDRFIDDMKAICGRYMLEVSSFEVDTQQAADLVILSGRNISIACRVRRPGYFSRFPNDFTVRAKVRTGAKTELSKIIDGWAEWMFYGHANAEETFVQHWMIIDLRAFRANLIRRRHEIKTIPNGDGTELAAFDVTQYQMPPILIASNFVEIAEQKTA